jgi:hypothetical protein
MKILTVAAVAILLFVFSFFTERPEPREKTPEPAPSAPEVVDREQIIHVDSTPLRFFSEEEFVEYVQNLQDEKTDTFSAYSEQDERLDMLSRYYRLKNVPEGATFPDVTVTEGTLFLTYYMQDIAYSQFRLITIRYSPYFTFDIETEGFWVERRFPEESYIREVDGLTYYIRKAESMENVFHWTVEWYNADGYHMFANFPYRFTADEVLGYVSDLEWVEIG